MSLLKVSAAPLLLCLACMKNYTYWKLGRRRRPVCGDCMSEYEDG